MIIKKLNIITNIKTLIINSIFFQFQILEFTSYFSNVLNLLLISKYLSLNLSNINGSTK